MSKFKAGDDVRWDGEGVYSAAFPQPVRITRVTLSHDPNVVGVFYSFAYRIDPDGYTLMAEGIPEVYLSPLGDRR
jgi:hypothetical protein